MDKEVKNRFELVKAMHTIVTSLNNEDGYYNCWIYTVPDCATEEDLLDIAEDEEAFKDTFNDFEYIMKEYLKDGIFVNGTLY